MAKIYAMIADGTEELEFVAVVDMLRRVKQDVTVVSVCGKTVTTSRQLKMEADCVIADVDFSDGNLIYLPGGMPGAEYFAKCGKLVQALKEYLNSGKRVAAICASPAVVLGQNGMTDGKRAVCYPGMEHLMRGVLPATGERVVTDGNLTTSVGPGSAAELGLELVKLLVGEKQANSLKQSMLIE